MRAEKGADVVEELIRDAPVLIHAINACEAYYDLLRRGNSRDAEALEGLLESSGIALDSDFSVDLWKTAGQIKARWKRVSLADCIALAVTLREGGTFLTSDHHELARLADEGLCPIRFIR